MTGPDRVDVLMPAPMAPDVIEAIERDFTLHRLWEQPDPDRYLAAVAPRIRGMAVGGAAGRIDGRWFDRLPALEIVAHFGVGYETIDAHAAAAQGIEVPEALLDIISATIDGGKH